MNDQSSKLEIRDPVILLSFINTQLRDHYASFEALCADQQLPAAEIIQLLRQINYEYVAEQNQFK